MPGTTGHTRIDELVARIATRVGELEAGSLDLEKLDALCDDVRELNERVIVLRHAARVDQVRGEGGPATAEMKEPAIRLDTTPPDPRQITLIEAIESEKKAKRDKREPGGVPAKSPMPAIPPADPIVSKGQAPLFKLAPQRPAPAGRPSLAQKLEHAPIKDLQKAIVISQKFWFINELFDKDASAYERTIKQLNAAGGLEEARAIVRSEVEQRSKKKPNEEALAQLIDLVERRFQ